MIPKEMHLYCCQTSSRKSLARMRAHGFRLLYTASPGASITLKPGFMYGIDNGAWWAYQNKRDWDPDLFLRAVDRIGGNADWVVVPDMVGDWARTAELAERWIPQLGGLPLLVAVQDGAREEDVGRLCAGRHGIFLGGSTDYKEQNAEQWGRFAHRHGIHYHIGRVNTARRLYLARAAGAHSVDGSSATRFSITAEKIRHWERQQPIDFAEAEIAEKLTTMVEDAEEIGQIDRVTFRGKNEAE